MSVNILTPNGRRMTVKVEPNRTVLWVSQFRISTTSLSCLLVFSIKILEEVCKKHNNFDPNQHGLKHHNKMLDLSQMFRFAGLPNNSNLEMVEVDQKRVEQELVICVQLESGTRVNGNFPSAATLREITTKLFPEVMGEYKYPVVIYMRSEYFDDSLDTTLKSLGLSSGGRALLRLVDKDPSTLKTQANISAPLPQKPKEEESDEKVTKVKQSNAPQPGPVSIINFADLKRVKEQVQNPLEKTFEPMEVEEQEKPDILQASPRVSPTDEGFVVIESPVQAVLNYLDERGSIVYSMNDLVTSKIDLPDSFFSVSADEIMKMQRELQREASEINDRPLMTESYRNLQQELKILDRLNVYKTVAIRIQFPDRFVLQSKFSVSKNIGTVMEFVRQYLAHPEKSFYLCKSDKQRCVRFLQTKIQFLDQTPPKKILEESTSLLNADCVPAAVLHYGCEDKDQVKDFLKPELYERLTTGIAISQALTGMEDDGEQSETSNKEPEKRPTVPKNFLQSSASTSRSTGAIPKWFKTGKWSVQKCDSMFVHFCTPINSWKYPLD